MKFKTLGQYVECIRCGKIQEIADRCTSCDIDFWGDSKSKKEDWLELQKLLAEVMVIEDIKGLVDVK